MLFRPFAALGRNSINARNFVLLITWLCGIILGLHIALYVGNEYHIYYYTAAREPAGFVGLLAVFFLPLLAVHCAFYFKKFFILFPVIALTGFNYGFNLSMIQVVYGQGAWLTGGFLLFSKSICVVLLYFLVRVCLTKQKPVFRNYCILYSFVACIVAALDSYFISSFFAFIL